MNDTSTDHDDDEDELEEEFDATDLFDERIETSQAPPRPMTPAPQQGEKFSHRPGLRRIAEPDTFERARSQLSPERQATLDRLKERFNEGRDSPIWEIVEALLFSESFYTTIPQQLERSAKGLFDTVESVAEMAASKVANELGTVDTKKLSAFIAHQVINGIQQGLSLRFKVQWAVVGALAALVLLVAGFGAGFALDLGRYREAYVAKEAALPHVRALLKSSAGDTLVELAGKNAAGTIQAIAQCSPALGLSIQRSERGGRVCAGSGATQGFIPAR
jgi:hypothetical protein